MAKVNTYFNMTVLGSLVAESFHTIRDVAGSNLGLGIGLRFSLCNIFPPHKFRNFYYILISVKQRIFQLSYMYL